MLDPNNPRSFRFATAQVGTRAAWMPIKDLTFAVEFLYTRDVQPPERILSVRRQRYHPPAGSRYELKNQILSNAAVNVTRSF